VKWLKSERKIGHGYANYIALQTSSLAAGALKIASDVPNITRSQVKRAKPDPDLFLAAAAALEYRSRRQWL
jgi:beta-phosphoglucomutase-like phosphatase (HAD superfamily)